MTTDLSTIDTGAIEARNAFAAVIGENPENIAIIDPEWSGFLRKGCLVKISIGRWRAEAAAKPSDMGVHPRNEKEKQAWNAVLKDMGTRRLLPSDVTEAHAKCENAARALWERYTLRTPWEDKGRFLVMGLAKDETATEPAKPEGWRYDDWKKANDALRAWYFELRDELKSKLPEYLDALSAQYAIMGFENYGRMQAMGIEVPDDVNEFVEAFVRHAMARVPSPDAIYESFYFDVKLSWVPLQSEVAADELKAGATRLENEEARQLAAAKTQAERDVIASEAKEAKEAANKFWTEILADLHGRVYGVCVDVLEALKRNDGELPTRSVVELRNLVKAMKELNFIDDKQLNEQTDAIRLMLMLPREDRDGAIADVMAEIGSRAKMVLHEIGRPPARSAREVGIPDAVAELTSVRRARHAAVLTEAPALLAPVRRGGGRVAAPQLQEAVA